MRTGPVPRLSWPLTPLQRGLLAPPHRRPGAARQVGQLAWRWHGPLDTARFTRAWQQVADCESVLRAGFEWRPEPRITVHAHATVEVVRHRAPAPGWEALAEHDRRRGFDPRRPALLRLTLVQGPAVPRGPVAPTRILLTYHPVMLDGWSALVLLHEFYRAYLADGAPTGGQRRPDMRDYAHWLAAQDTAPAREFWSQALPGDASAVLTAPIAPAAPAAPAGPGGPSAPSGRAGTGRAEARLVRADAERLRRWAAGHAATESIALQAVWALLLYRAGGTTAPAPVGFGVSVSGRGIALDSVERLPGLLLNALPVVVRVDPDHSLSQLLAGLRDQALGMAGYEWVSAEQIRAWCGRAPGQDLIESLIAFQHLPPLPADLEQALAAQGVRVEAPEASGWCTAFPLALLGYRDTDGGLVLAAVHDRGRVADGDAQRLVRLCARLLRDLPALPGRNPTTADVLATVAGDELPRIAG